MNSFKIKNIKFNKTVNLIFEKSSDDELYFIEFFYSADNKCDLWCGNINKIRFVYYYKCLKILPHVYGNITIINDCEHTKVTETNLMGFYKFYNNKRDFENKLKAIKLL